MKEQVTSNNYKMNIGTKDCCRNFSYVDIGPHRITAANKPLIELCDEYKCQRGFEAKRVMHWTSGDVMNWFYNVVEIVEEQEIVESKWHNFNVDGATLLTMKEDDFIGKDPKFGHLVFTHLQRRLKKECEQPDVFTLLHERHILNEQASPIQRRPLFQPTAAGKPLIFQDLDSVWETEWARKKISNWSQQDAAAWLLHSLREEHLHVDEVLILTEFSFNGEQLLQMTVNDFVNINPQYGQVLFHRLEIEKRRKTLLNCRSDSEDSSDGSEEIHSEVAGGLQRKKPGGHGRLWLFVRELLKSRRFPEVIDWIDREKGVFRVKDSKKLADLWGGARNNPGMTYEKMARALRYNYKSGYLGSVKGRKLVFAFGPNATEWKEEPSSSQQDMRT